MTTRRKMLGLLAIAPIAPLIAKSALEPRFHSGGVIGEAFSSGLVGERCQDFVLSPSQSKAFFASLAEPAAPNEPLRMLLRASTPWEVPNRLFGAAITIEGDAV